MSENRTINTWRDPYEAGFSTTRSKKVIFTKGITVLVGCNGAGKTTLLYNIESELSKTKTPVFKYDSKTSTENLTSEAAFHNDFETVCISKCSSEGENIGLSLGQTLTRLRYFIKTGMDPKKKLSFMLKEEKNESIESNERWILIDAVDSGYSIDNIVELKTIFKYMQNDASANNVDLYIIVSANAYEVANGENCLDVMSGKNIRFESYDEYKRFILKTREKKEKRYNRKV